MEGHALSCPQELRRDETRPSIHKSSCSSLMRNYLLALLYATVNPPCGVTTFLGQREIGIGLFTEIEFVVDSSRCDIITVENFKYLRVPK